MNNTTESNKLDIGCGLFKQPGAIGMDWNPNTLADVVHNLNQFPYPFGDNCFDEIYCNHVLEHMPNLILVMEELYRIAKPNGIIYIVTPYWSSHRAFKDPTHLRYFTENTFDYFTPESRMNFYTQARFAVRKKTIELSHKFIVRVLARFLPNTFFKLFNNLIANVSFELQALKDPVNMLTYGDCPKISIVLLNWNNYPDTRDCLKSLASISYPNCGIILVDNCSTDGSGDKVHHQFPQYPYLQTDANLGFSGGCNVGIKYALDHGADYVMLLNNDTIVDKNFLEPLAQILKEKEEVGIAGGKGYYFDRPNRIHMAGARLDWIRATYKRFGDDQIDRGQFDQPREVDMVSAYFMLIKKSVFEKIGFLPEEYFGGMEECDFVLHAREAGFQVWYIPQSCIWHKIGRSFTAASKTPKYLYNCYRNKILFMKRFLPPVRFRCWLFFFELYARYIASWRLKWKAAKSGQRIQGKLLSTAINLALEDAKHKDRVSIDDIQEVEKTIHELSVKYNS